MDGSEIPEESGGSAAAGAKERRQDCQRDDRFFAGAGADGSARAIDDVVNVTAGAYQPLALPNECGIRSVSIGRRYLSGLA
jgi:hypothetical protein